MRAPEVFLRMLLMALVVAGTTLPMGILLAQAVKMEPGPAQEKLEFLVGTWKVASKAYFGDEVHQGTSTVTFRWLKGGVWLLEELDMPSTPIGPMAGSARLAWDEEAKTYVRYYVDNQSPVLLPSRGRWLDDTTLEFRGSFTWEDGTIYHTRRVIKITAEGWTETGHMGPDPDNLRLNHESSARRLP